MKKYCLSVLFLALSLPAMAQVPNEVHDTALSENFDYLYEQILAINSGLTLKDLRWDGSADQLNAATGRASLGLGTLAVKSAVSLSDCNFSVATSTHIAAEVSARAAADDEIAVSTTALSISTASLQEQINGIGVSTATASALAELSTSTSALKVRLDNVDMSTAATVKQLAELSVSTSSLQTEIDNIGEMSGLSVELDEITISTTALRGDVSDLSVSTAAIEAHLYLLDQSTGTILSTTTIAGSSMTWTTPQTFGKTALVDGGISSDNSQIELDRPLLAANPIPGGYDSYTKLMLHFDGSLADSSGHCATPTETESFVDGKFGRALAAGAHAYYISNDGFNCSASGTACTIDFWMQCYAANYGVALMGYPGGDGHTFIYTGNNGVCIGIQGSTELCANNSMEVGNWYHVAIVKNGTTTNIYVNGENAARSTNFAWSLIPIFEVDPYYGPVDEIRFSKGIARWTEDFTPPTVPYSAATAASARATMDVLPSGNDFILAVSTDMYSYSLVVSSMGAVGIGTNQPAVQLDVNGEIRGSTVTAAALTLNGETITEWPVTAIDTTTIAGSVITWSAAQSFDAGASFSAITLGGETLAAWPSGGTSISSDTITQSTVTVTINGGANTFVIDGSSVDVVAGAGTTSNGYPIVYEVLIASQTFAENTASWNFAVPYSTWTYHLHYRMKWAGSVGTVALRPNNATTTYRTTQWSDDTNGNNGNDKNGEADGIYPMASQYNIMVGGHTTADVHFDATAPDGAGDYYSFLWQANGQYDTSFWRHSIGECTWTGDVMSSIYVVATSGYFAPGSTIVVYGKPQ